MRSIYNPINTSVSVHALSKLSMGSSTYFEEGRKVLGKSLRLIALLDVQIMDSKEGGIMFMNGADRSLV